MKKNVHDNNEIEAAKINAEGTIIASKINTKGAIIVAIIALITGIVGTLLGSILESNKGQITLNQTFYGIIENKNNDDITLEEIKQNYIQLQSDYDKLQSANQVLSNNNKNEIDKLNNANDQIEDLLIQIEEANQEIANLKIQFNSMPIVDYKNLSLCIDANDIPINSNKSIAVIDGRDYFSKEIVENLITEDNNLTIKDGTIFVGKVIAEKAKLTDQSIMGQTHCLVEDTSTDIHGHTYTNCITLGNSYYDNGIIKYSVDNKYSYLKGTISISSNSEMGRKGSITIKADGDVIYNKDFDIDSSDELIDIPINNCAIIDIVYEGNSRFYITISGGILYN